MKQYLIRRLPQDKGFTPHLRVGAGFTLVEALLTISILSLVMVAMVPFIRTVYTSWNVGSRKTEILQNGRVGLEMMSRYIRQAKRITGIPATGSGNFIKLRYSSDNQSDNQTIIFYHNISGSPYYIGNVGLIGDNDLVMRTIDTNGTTDALLAKSLNNFKIDFKDSTGQVATKPYDVNSLDVYTSLTDPENIISDTIDAFSSISLRTEVRINKPVWVGSANFVTELSTDNWVEGFSNANSISVNTSTSECWVADTGNDSIKKLSTTGTVLVTLVNFSQPNSVSVNNVLLVNGRETVWVADTGNDHIRCIYWDGSNWVYDTITGGVGTARFSAPRSVSVNPYEKVNGRETCWVADTGRNRIRGVYWTGTTWAIINITGFSSPYSVSVNPNEKVNNRNTCWVADTNGNRVRKIYWTGTAYTYRNLSMGVGSMPRSVSVNPNDGTCWVANSGRGAANGNRIRKLSSLGTNPITILFTVTGFSTPYAVWANPSDGSCWVVDTGNNQVVKLDAEGNEEFRISGFSSPLSVGGQP